MKTSTVLAIAALAVAASAPVRAAGNPAGQKLAEAKQCMGCHALATEGAGPSFKKVAVFWRGRKDAEKNLVGTILQGSSATGGPHWNKATMPDQAERPRVSEAEARRIARWILAQ